MKSILQPLFDVLPLERAMPSLLPSTRLSDPVVLKIAQELVETLESPALKSAIWLYVDDLDASHEISQSLYTPQGSFLHGVMHRREGDFSNAKYWFRMAGVVPFQLEGYDPFEFADLVSRAKGDPFDLVDLQRREWMALSQCL